jgi:hypothetical protein
MKESQSSYRQLEAAKIIDTVQALQVRIRERFPDSSLKQVVADLLTVAQESVARNAWIQKPHLPLRFGAVFLSLAIIGILVSMVMSIHQFQFNDYTNFIQALDATISAVVFTGAAILFLLSCEVRIKRNRALKALHELRSLAHIVDMHQLTKDPESFFGVSVATSSSPTRAMTPFELNRYLDYCSEALALISKIAALYVQNFQDPILLNAVDDVEDLTAGFSRKIWQKITILETLNRDLVDRPDDKRG